MSGEEYNRLSEDAASRIRRAARKAISGDAEMIRCFSHFGISVNELEPVMRELDAGTLPSYYGEHGNQNPSCPKGNS